ncbi:MAG: peptidylprolyl isomerase [Proteobacteria bacterium]|nr:peptidylprolyl isomerase [Pseudomonadota bacterium]
MLVERSAKLYALIIIILITAFNPWFTEQCLAKKIEDKEFGKIVAKVNGQPIYQSTLVSAVEEYKKKYSKFGMKNPRPVFIKTLQKQALDKIIEDEVLSQASLVHQVPDIKEQINEQVVKLKAQLKTREKFDQYLAKRQLDNERLELWLKQKIQINSYLKSQGLSSSQVSEEEIQSFYEKSKEGFRREESVKVRHILVQLNPDAGPEETAIARKKIEKAREKILSGKSFSEVAKEDSQCNSASGGGEIDYINHGYMPKEFDEVAFSLEAGTLSQVVRTTFGFHIIEVLDKQPGGIPSLAAMRDFINKYLEQQALQKKLADHIENLKKNAAIEIFEGAIGT